MSITKKITGDYKLLTTGEVLVPGTLVAGNIRTKNNTISLNSDYGNLYLRASGTGNINVGNSRITEVATPLESSDAVNKNYVDQTIVDLNLKPVASSGSYNDLIDKPCQRFEFPNRSTVWLVQHNRNTRHIFEKLADSDGNRFYAGIKILDENSFVVNLTESGTGTVDVFFG
ncbi:hypothetical protein UFOVP116_3 [uncultured Caudovirales phage]|uniref:Uncharacterized protein n=1 Tax=uncultured Caudovirales phage TaxID=2100421 RepID=A0A6J5L4P6_9CAUD|nr:hypothetical protein UFOVP116_3 [uncultured Caudovirales phage]